MFGDTLHMTDAIRKPNSVLSGSKTNRAQSRLGGRLMSQGPWKINEGRFLHQITFTYYTCFLLKTQDPTGLSGPGLERCD